MALPGLCGPSPGSIPPRRRNRGSQRAPITKPIPSTGERIPVIGLGTNQYNAKAPEEIARLQIVLETMLAQGGSVVDTARVYGRSEEVIGELVRNIGRAIASLS